MKEMVLYFCHLKSKNAFHDRLERFEVGSEPDYFDWLKGKRNENVSVIVNHGITYYKTNVSKSNLKNDETK